MSARESSSRNRADASAGLPSGAPTSTTDPVAAGLSPTEVSFGSDGCPGRLPDAAYDRRVSVGVVTDERPGADTEEPAAVARPSLVPESLRRRLTPVERGTRKTWAAALWVVAIAAILRLVNLGLPNQIVF